MLIKGRVVDQDSQQPISSIKVRVFKDQDDASRYKVMTDRNGDFTIIVPDDLAIAGSSGQKSLQLTATKSEYDPVEMTIATPTSDAREIELAIQMEKWKGKAHRWVPAYVAIALLVILGLVIARLYVGVLFYDKARFAPGLEASIKAMEDHLKGAKDKKDDFFKEAGKGWLDKLSNLTQQIDRDLGDLRKVAGQRPTPASRHRAFFMSLWVPAFLLETFWQNKYWWNVVVWSLFGALLGLLWVNVRSIIDENFKPKYLSTIPYRLFAAPLYAIALIFFARVIGFAVDAITSLQKSPSPAPTPLSSGLAMGVAFLVGLFIERAHMRLRSFAERLFPSEYLGGKPKQ